MLEEEEEEEEGGDDMKVDDRAKVALDVPHIYAEHQQNSPPGSVVQ